MNSRCLPLVYLQSINNRFTSTGEKQQRLYIYIYIYIYARNPETCRQTSSGGSGTKARLSNQNEHQSRPTPERANRTSPRLQGERRQNDQNERPNGRTARQEGKGPSCQNERPQNVKGTADKSNQITRQKRVPWLWSHTRRRRRKQERNQWNVGW